MAVWVEAMGFPFMMTSSVRELIWPWQYGTVIYSSRQMASFAHPKMLSFKFS
jgi:hypothetical protein